jgi:hypothetical protein
VHDSWESPTESSQGRRPPYRTLLVVLALLVASVSTFLVLKDGDGAKPGGGSSATAESKLDQAGFKRIDLASGTDVGRAVTDTGLQFTVGHPRCGGAEYRTLKAVGEFCLVPLTIYNPGTKKGPRLPRDAQLLITDTGSQIKATEFKDGFLNTWPEVEPGGQIAGELLFELPDDREPKEIQVHATADSSGVAVKL